MEEADVSKFPKDVARFPRESNAIQLVHIDAGKDEVELTAEAKVWIQRGHDANVEAGRIFRKLKDMLGHGNWQRHFQKHFAPMGVALRTAREWMAMAKREDAEPKTADSADLPHDRRAKPDDTRVAPHSTGPRPVLAKSNPNNNHHEPARFPREWQPETVECELPPLKVLPELRDRFRPLIQSKWSMVEKEIVGVLLRLTEGRHS